MNSLTDVTIQELRRAVGLKEQIESLEAELTRLLVGTGTPGRTGKKSKRSPATRAKMAAAQKARWAKGRRKVAGNGKVVKRTMSAAGRARIATAARARWAKAKKEGKRTLAA